MILLTLGAKFGNVKALVALTGVVSKYYIDYKCVKYERIIDNKDVINNAPDNNMISLKGPRWPKDAARK